MSRDGSRPLGVLRVDTLGFRVQVGLLAAAEDDLGAVLGQGAGDRAADPAAGSGHERDAPGKVEKGARGHD